jgi:hypothetical protein
MNECGIWWIKDSSSSKDEANTGHDKSKAKIKRKRNKNQILK